ncbi:hypothetical protein CGLO_09518 [Colletotrichum gloeosporioides Cg-14]|uniref:Uncharacterized protein n=1 Tax=Colletotrichum gloeosporioides (strain Cg-14) TaxID=1237896 RepID=T0K6A2_COLGC|nr:hypothetical protein CGLO_09518 [Colletotrichum gloeosporioides Cg-14]
MAPLKLMRPLFSAYFYTVNCF